MKRIFALFMLAVLLLISLTACSGSNEQNPPPVSSQEDEKTSAQPSVKEDEPKAEAETDPEPDPEPEDLPDERGIIGSHGTDIRMGLTKFGLEEAPISSAPDEALDVYAFSSSTMYQDEVLGVSYDYSLIMDNDFQIIEASFGIENDSAPEDIFVALAELYLGFSATMPYEASSSNDAKNWVEESITKFSGDTEISTTIGDAKFELYGTETGDGYGAIWMDISKVII